MVQGSGDAPRFNQSPHTASPKEAAMNYLKQGLRVLGLSLLAILGLVVFTVSGALASGTVLVEGLSPPFTVEIKGKQHNALEGRLLILSLNMEIFCHNASVSGTLSSAGAGKGTITFKGCLAQAVTNGDVLTGQICELEDMVVKGVALVILHSGNTALTLEQHGTGTGEPYLLVTPEGGVSGSFVTIVNETECALPEEVKVKGCGVVRIVTTGDQIEHLVSTKGMLSLFGCKLSYGSNESHLDADAFVSLTGSHAGLSWGAE